MDSHLKASTRCYVLLARAADVAVIFRRGPTRLVQLIRWDTRTDIFEPGQWLKGRIYERRCDLSPLGRRLVYFAANFKNPYQTWTAVSRPPYLTALAFWPKGDAWGGGGLFESENHLLLNHLPFQNRLAPHFHLPKQVKVGLLGDRPGMGEDQPILGMRLRRDGWSLAQKGVIVRNAFTAKVWHEYTPPEIWQQPRPVKGSEWAVEMIVRGLHQRSGPWYWLEHRLVDHRTGEEIPLGDSDWAGWCHAGDLLLSQKGQIFRLPFEKQAKGGPAGEKRLLIDLGENSFEAIEAPEWARRWE